jgi:hypothetical protein
VWIEPLFAEGKLWHGMRRFRMRTLGRNKAAADFCRSWTEEAGSGRGSAVPVANSGSHTPTCFEVPQSTTSALRESFSNTLDCFSDHQTSVATVFASADADYDNGAAF